jgi:hypothetical protein
MPSQARPRSVAIGLRESPSLLRPPDCWRAAKAGRAKVRQPADDGGHRFSLGRSMEAVAQLTESCARGLSAASPPIAGEVYRPGT